MTKQKKGFFRGIGRFFRKAVYFVKGLFESPVEDAVDAVEKFKEIIERDAWDDVTSVTKIKDEKVLRLLRRAAPFVLVILQSIGLAQGCQAQNVMEKIFCIGKVLKDNRLGDSLRNFILRLLAEKILVTGAYSPPMGMTIGKAVEDTYQVIVKDK